MPTESNGFDFDLDKIVDARTAAGPGGDAPAAVRADARRLVPVRRASTFRGLLSAINRRRWLALGIFLIVSGGGAFAALREAPVYEARARLMIEPAARRGAAARAVTDESRALMHELRQDRRTRSATAISQRIQRRDLAARTLEDSGLWDVMGGARPRRGEDGADPKAARSRAIRRLLAGFHVSQVENSRLIDLRFRGADPELAARIANGMAESFVALSRESRVSAARDATAWLDERLLELSQQIAAAEEALQRHRERYGVMPSGRTSTTMRRLLDTSAAFTRARTLRFEKDVLQRQLAGGVDDVSVIESFPAVFNNPVIQREKVNLERLEREESELAIRLGDKHPQLQSVRRAIEQSEIRLREEVERAGQTASHELAAARAQEESLGQALAVLKTEALATNHASIQFGVLAAELESVQRLYTSLRRRHDEIRMATELTSSGVRILDRAEQPAHPVDQGLLRKLLLGLVGALGLSLGVSLAVDHADGTMRNSGDVLRRTGLQTLGSLPSVRGASAEGMAPVLTGTTPPGFAEAVKRLRTNVEFAVPKDGDRARVIVVTSAEPCDGKSTTAANLALAMVQADYKVLLIDADMRRPTQEAIFKAGPGPGLSEALARASEARPLEVQAIGGFDLLHAGAIPPNPSELLGSRRFSEILAAFASEYDWIILDTPPVLAVTDASLVSQHAAGVVVVLRAGKTNYRPVLLAIEQLHRIHAPVRGAVLNGSRRDHGAL